LIDEHDVLHRVVLLVTTRWSRTKTNDEPGSRQLHAGNLSQLPVGNP
jgi:hypothetical protein